MYTDNADLENIYDEKEHIRKFSDLTGDDFNFFDSVSTLKTHSCTICVGNEIEVETGTNGFKGGDFGHGSRAYLRISTNEDSDDIGMRVSYDKSNGLTNLEIMLGGDWELRTILTALKYMVNVLEKDIKEHENDKKEE